MTYQSIQWRHWLAQLPNKLTFARIACVPILVILYPLNFFALNLFCAVLFALAAATDFFDGYLARKYGSESKFGALIDPVADKLLVTSALIILLYAKAIPPFLAAILICRDLIVSGFRLIAAEQNFALNVNDVGKWKTALQDIAIFLLLINNNLFDWPIRQTGMMCLWLAAGFSLYSAWMYWNIFWKNAKFS